MEHFISIDLGAYTEGKTRTARKRVATEEDCQGTEDPRVAKDEKRTGRRLLLIKSKYVRNVYNYTIMSH